MNPNFAEKIGFRIFEIKFDTQKIDCLKLDTFDMVIVLFCMENKKRRFCFFEGMFFLADISVDSTLGILFLNLNNVEIDFVDHKI